jgi:hypothetical protein
MSCPAPRLLLLKKLQALTDFYVGRTSRLPQWLGVIWNQPVRTQEKELAMDPEARFASPLGAAPRLSDELVARGIAYGSKRTPGTWMHNDRGHIIAVPVDKSPLHGTYRVATVTERYTDEVTNDDSTFIVEAVNHLELALHEIQARRARENSADNAADTAEEIRAELREIIACAEREHRLIDPRDLYALADVPLAQLKTEADSDNLFCLNCQRIFHQAIHARAIKITGPVRICECAVDRSALATTAAPTNDNALEPTLIAAP